MGTRDTSWPAGTPCWVDCGFEDLGRARKFYGHLFGWDTEQGPAETGDYTMCLKNGRPAAALATSPDEGVPTYWSTYFATDDVEATTEAVTAAGGEVVASMDVSSFGRMAVYRDPTGAVFSVWQAQDHIGFGIFNEVGTVTWNDLMTRDLETAKTFYAAVFGFTYEDMGGGYQTVKTADGRTVAGMHQAEQLPDDVPANWLVHFVVADRDSAVSLIEMEDDTAILMTLDTPFGPEAVVQGPEGEVFNVISLSDEVSDEG